jgi:hypothetical protein
MLKDTKSLGNNKAPACESRGFVLKKEGVLFDTPSFCSVKKLRTERQKQDSVNRKLLQKFRHKNIKT